MLVMTMESERQWQGWEDFLRLKADNGGLADTETQAFIKSFIRENLNKTTSQIAIEMPNYNDDEAYNKAMGRVYKKFKITGTKGKHQRFLKKLEDEYWKSEFASQLYNKHEVNVSEFIDKLRNRCIELFNNEKLLTTDSLIAKQGMTFKINDLFVLLGLVERQRPSKRQDIESADLGSQLYQPTEDNKTKFDDQQQFFDQVIRDCNTPNSKGKRIAIIGEAGSGKTTLLQKIGEQLLQNSIPIWISLKRKGNQTLHEYLMGDWLRNAAEVLDNVPEEWKTALEELLKSNQVFLLLDGVDEMTTTSPLQVIGEQINQYDIFHSVRVILTCRSNLWEDYALPGFDAYRNLDFDYPTQVEQFIDKFFQNSTENKDLGETLKTELRLENKYRIRDLVKNPLRLFLLCYAWILGDGKLPDTQAELYKVFVENFYKVYQLKGSNFTIPVPKRKELEKGLGELSKKALDDKKFLLPESVIEQYLGHPDDKDSLFYLGKKLNLLNCVGKCAENPFEDAYAFLHSTFQEYFAALVIDDWYFFLPDNHVDKPINQKYLVFDSNWLQVIIFWMGRPDKTIYVMNNKKKFIENLFSFYDGCSRFYSLKAQFLATNLIVEFTNCPSDIAKNIFMETFKYALGCFNPETKKWGYFFQPISETALKILIDLKESTFTYHFKNFINIHNVCPETMKSILLYIQDLLWQQVQTPKNLSNFLKNSIIDEIKTESYDFSKILDNCKDVDILEDVIFEIEMVGKINENVIVKLINLLENPEFSGEQYTDLKLNIIRFLGKIGKRDQRLINILLKILDDNIISLDVDAFNVMNILNILSEIAPGNSIAIDRLHSHLISLKKQKINIYTNYGNEEDPVSTPSNLLNIQQIQEIIFNLAQALLKINPENLKITQYFIDLFKQTDNVEIYNSIKYVLTESISVKEAMKLVVISLKDFLDEYNQKNNYLKYQASYEILWHCAQHMSYPEFYQAWHEPDTTTEQLETQYNDLGKLLNQLQPTDQVYPILIDGKYSLENLTDESAIAQELCNKIYEAIFPDDDIPTVKNAPELKRLFPKFKRQVNRLTLVFIIYNIEPYPELINVCRQLLGKFHIAFITDQEIEPDLRGFPMQDNLVNILQNWLTEISYKETL